MGVLSTGLIQRGHEYAPKKKPNEKIICLRPQPRLSNYASSDMFKVHRSIQPGVTYNIVCEGMQTGRYVSFGLLFFKRNELVAFANGSWSRGIGTGNRAKLIAISEALSAAEKLLTDDLKLAQIICNSSYGFSAITNASKHEARGWMTSGGRPIANVEIIKNVHAMYSGMKDQIVLTDVAKHTEPLLILAAKELAVAASHVAMDGVEYGDVIDLENIIGYVPDALIPSE